MGPASHIVDSWGLLEEYKHVERGGVLGASAAVRGCHEADSWAVPLMILFSCEIVMFQSDVSFVY